MANFGAPTFDDAPRHESPGEKIHRWAGNVGLLEKYLGAKLTPEERVQIAKFIIEVTDRLSKEEVAQLAGTLAFAISWVTKMKAALG